MRARPALIALLTAALMLTAPLASARGKDRGERERDDRGGFIGFPRQGGAVPDGLVDRGGTAHGASRLSAGQAARQAQARNGGGKVISVDPTDDGYRVKLLRRGDVRVLHIPDEP